MRGQILSSAPFLAYELVRPRLLLILLRSSGTERFDRCRGDILGVARSPGRRCRLRWCELVVGNALVRACARGGSVTVRDFSRRLVLVQMSCFRFDEWVKCVDLTFTGP